MVSLALAALLILFVHASLFAQPTALSAPTNGLVLFWPLAGSTADESAELNNGVSSGALKTVDRFGTPNAAYRFNGTASYIQAQRALPDSQSVTVSLWFSLDSWVQAKNWEAPQVLFFEGDDTPGHDLACVLSGGVHFTTKNDARLTYANWLPPVKTWTHLVCVADAINHKVALWVGGQKVQEAAFTTGANIGYHAPFNLGRRPGGYNDWFFGGSVDQVRVYNRALTSAEIEALYASEAGTSRSVDIEIASYRLVLRALPGKPYILQSSDDLTAWVDFGSVFVATAPDYQTTVPAGTHHRFWRAVESGVSK